MRIDFPLPVDRAAPPVGLTAGGQTYGFRFTETITPSATVAAPVAIGLRNDLTISGDMSKVTGATDLLSGNYTTTFSGVSTGPVTTMGTFQAGLYIDNTNAGITFNGLRGFVYHGEVNSACTVTLLKGVEFNLTNNAGTISNLRWIDIPDTSATTGGGSIANEWALYSPGQAKVEVAGVGRFGKLDVTSTSSSGVTNGIYLNAASQLGFVTSGSVRMFLNSGGLATSSQGFLLVATTNAAATVPTLCPNASDTKAGVGANAAGNVSLIANNGGTATEVFRATGTNATALVPIVFPVYTVATLPASPAAYSRAFVSDASAPSFGATVSGGGATKTPVWYDGAAWKVG